MDQPYNLTAHRFLLRLSLSFGGVFAWILIFHALYVTGETVAGALFLTACAYSFMQLCVFFLTPIAGSNVGNGTVRAMILATIAQAAAFLWLAASSAGVFGVHALNVWWGITGFVVLSSLYRAFYWIPYKALSLTVSGGWSPRTRFLLEIFLALSPVAASLLITFRDAGTWLVLILAAIISFFSSLALVRVQDSYERFEWGFVETIHRLFRRDNGALLSSSLLDGVQGAGMLFVWPLTIFLLLGWSYFTLGLLFSISILFVLLTRRFVNKRLHRWALHDNHRFLAVIAGSAWVLRLVIVSPATFVVADILYHTGVPARRLGMDPIAFEQSADSSHYIDEYTALKEMGASLGRIVTCLVLVSALFFATPELALGIALIFVAVSSIISIYHDYMRV